jgi:hypothetical protein
MTERLERRRFLGAAAAGALLGSPSSQADTAGQREVRLKSLHPKEYETLDCFTNAEATLVARQLAAPRGKNAVWTAWRNAATAMRDYGRQLAEERFDEIRTCVAKL